MDDGDATDLRIGGKFSPAAAADQIFAAFNIGRMPPRKKPRLDSQLQRLAQNTSNAKDKSREKGPKPVENENDMSEEEVLEDEFDVDERDVSERTARTTLGFREIDCSDEMAVEEGENAGDSEDDDFKDVKSKSPFPVSTQLTIRTKKSIK